MPRKRTLWFRFYCEAIHDRKLRRQDPAVRWLWVAVLAVARTSPEPGTLLVAVEGDDTPDPVTVDDLADEAALPRKTVAKGMAEFVRLGMVEVDDEDVWVVPRWGERQFESDDTTARTRKHRSEEQRRNVPTTPVGTGSSRARATEAETETEDPPPSTTSRVAPPRTDRASRLPDGWTPHPEPDLVQAVGGEVAARRERAKFGDYWAAKPGKDGRKLDWQATWRNWLRRASEDRGRPNGQPDYTAALAQLED